LPAAIRLAFDDNREDNTDKSRSYAPLTQKPNCPERQWQEVGTAIETESTLVEQPKGAELEYRVIAINKSGEGSPSNTVMVVL
jgi:hypothetical protein